MYCDTHCHLDLPHFDADRPAVIERAGAAGVGLIVNPGIDLNSCRRALALADRYPNIFAAVGVHPNDCADFDDTTIMALRRLAQRPKVVAIGEIGLDYYWEKVAHDQQKTALRAQLALAAELNLPVILHSRNPRGNDSRQCNTDLLWELEQWVFVTQTQRGEAAILGDTALIPDPCALTPEVLVGVWHAFSGDLAEAQAAYDLGLALGLGGPATFQNAHRLHALIPQLRLDRLLLETDAPFLPPHPYRGQRNEPAYVPLIAQTLAQLFGIAPETVAEQTTATAQRCFGTIVENRKT
ncbi:MAG: TatD family hydrolase [Chloroflexi bacterium]|nr:TatD family hydrolase [Chloroflexota bacterium]